MKKPMLSLLSVICLFLIHLVSFAQPGNDSICHAIAIPVNGSANCYNIIGAGVEGNDPNHSCGSTSYTVWFKFQAPSSGSVIISTDHNGTDFNTILSAFSASSCNGPYIEVGCNDDGQQNIINFSSDLPLDCLTPFSEYFIMVDGSAGASGLVCMSISANAGFAVGADNSCSGSLIPVNGTSFCFSNKCATASSGEPVGSTWSDGVQNSVWATFVAPASGAVSISTDNAGTTLNNQIALYSTACPGNFANEIGSDEGSGAAPGTSKILTCSVNPGLLYWLQIDGVAGDTGEVCLSVSNLSAGNYTKGANLICNATNLPVDGSTRSFNNICADAEIAEPAGNNWKSFIPGNTTWHSFVAPSNGRVTISTHNGSTNFDTQIAVYLSSDGTCNGTLTEVGSDDDSGVGLSAELSLVCLEPGATYFIQVDGYNLESGDYGIMVSNDPGANAVSNDSICDAIRLIPDSAAGNFGNFCADTEVGEVVPSCFSLENSIYFIFQPPSSGNITINVTNNTFPVELAVYEKLDSACADPLNYREVACDTAHTEPVINLNCLNPFSQYIILIDAVAGTEGTLDIEIVDNGGTAAGSDLSCQALFLDVNPGIQTFSNVCAGASIGEVVPPAGSSCTVLDGWCASEPPAVDNSIWFYITPKQSGYLTISTDNDSTNFDTQIALWNAGDCSDFLSYTLVAANDNCPGGCSASNLMASTLSSCIDSGKIYYLQIDGFNGATGTIGIETDLVPFQPMTSGDVNSCVNDSITLSASGGASYLWSTGDTASSLTVKAIQDAIYSVTITGANGCTASDSMEIIVNAIPPADAGNDTITCAGNTIDLMASGGIQYLWTTGDTTAQISVSTLVDSTFAVTVTDTNGCSNADSIYISVISGPAIQISNDTIICKGTSAQLKVTGADSLSYVWNNGDSTNQIMVNPLTTTTYKITVTDTLGCTTKEDVVVFVSALPDPDLGNDTVICSNDTLLITASGGMNYSWNTNDTTQTISVSPAISTTYSVTVTNINDCVGTDSVNVFVNPGPSVELYDTAICMGSSIMLDAGGQVANYLWSTGETTSTITVSSADTYRVTVIDTMKCKTLDSSIVTVKSLPVVTLSGLDSLYCQNAGQVVLSGGMPQGGVYEINGISAVVFDPAALGVGTHVVTYTYSDMSGCIDSSSVNVLVDPCTGFPLSEDHDKVSVYPNPVSDKINVSIHVNQNQVVQFHLFDVLGKTIMEKKTDALTGENNFVLIPDAAFKPGIYLLQVLINNKAYRFKLSSLR